MAKRDAPFTTIESAQEFLTLLSEQIDEATADVRAEFEACGPNEARRAEAWQVVLYTLSKLSTHVGSSRRLLNDLRTLRNLLSRTGDGERGGSASRQTTAP